MKLEGVGPLPHESRAVQFGLPLFGPDVGVRRYLCLVDRQNGRYP